MGLTKKEKRKLQRKNVVSNILGGYKYCEECGVRLKIKEKVERRCNRCL